MRFKLVPFVGALMASAILAPAALAVPGDRAIDDPAPGEYRLSPRDLEPGCFSPRYMPSNIDLSSFDLDVLPNEELRVSNTSGSMLFSYNIDQILVPAHGGGYAVYDSFNRHGADIAPGEQEGEMFAPGDGAIENDDVILCVSDETAPQNEPYNQEAGDLVSAKNRPIIQPKVTALGVSALNALNTYKVGFGYSVEKWYTAPTFDGHGLFRAVTDPETSVFDAMGIPSVVRLRARLDDLPYDTRRVNDVDKAGESWTGGDADAGQDVYFSRNGDDTAWTDSNGNGLLTTLTEGDLPIQWSLRPSLAGPASLREAQLTDDQLRAWNAAWQAYYRGAGAKPTLPLAPGTNSPKPNTSVVVNMPETRPTSAPQVVVTVGGGVASQPSGACQGYRLVRVRFAHNVSKGKIRYNGKTIKAKMRDGRLRATAKLFGVRAASLNSRTKIVKMSKVHGTWHKKTIRVKICA